MLFIVGKLNRFPRYFINVPHATSPLQRPYSALIAPLVRYKRTLCSLLQPPVIDLLST
jgi:hypothetical protein